MEIVSSGKLIFEAYLNAFSKYKPHEFKIVVIDNAGFHSTKNITVPPNIFLLRIPPYNPELNPCEQVWQYIKNRYKNKRFKTMTNLKEWLHQTVKNMSPKTIKSITSIYFTTLQSSGSKLPTCSIYFWEYLGPSILDKFLCIIT